jgi:pimeloyl-ACP methyl ester carboxylesterase
MPDWSSGDVTVHGDAAAGSARIHYHRTGGDKPPLVLFHGFSDNGLCWTRVAQVLEKNYDLIMPDARGHGLSEAPEGEYTARVHAADLAALIQALGLGKPALMGHSMGGSTVANTAAFYPDLVACAVLEDPSLAAPDTPRANAAPREREARTARNRARILRFQEMTRAEVVQEGRKEHPSWDEVEFGPWADAKQQMSVNVFQGSLGKGLAEMRGQWQEIGPQLQCPTLLVTADAERGAIITPETARRVTQMNDRIQVVRLEGAGHNIRRERFEGFVEAVTAFLAQVYLGS